jgi:hypothetical protein
MAEAGVTVEAATDRDTDKTLYDQSRRTSRGAGSIGVLRDSRPNNKTASPGACPQSKILCFFDRKMKKVLDE